MRSTWATNTTRCSFATRKRRYSGLRIDCLVVWSFLSNNQVLSFSIESKLLKVPAASGNLCHEAFKSTLTNVTISHFHTYRALAYCRAGISGQRLVHDRCKRQPATSPGDSWLDPCKALSNAKPVMGIAKVRTCTDMLKSCLFHASFLLTVRTKMKNIP